MKSRRRALKQKGGDNACSMFYEGSQLTQGSSTYVPAHLLTPSALTDFSDEHVLKWMHIMDEVDAMNGNNLLIVSLGDDMERKYINNATNLFSTILREPTKTIFQKYIEETPNQFMVVNVFPSNETSPTFEIHKSGSFTDTPFLNTMLTVDGLFPLTPIYGPHPAYSANNYTKRKNSGYCNGCRHTDPKTRRILFSNTIKILKRFIQYAGPLILDSGINTICYRSLLYIADKRKTLGKETHVVCGYTTNGRPVRTYTPSNLFPRPFEKCRNYVKTPKAFGTYYAHPSVKLSQNKIDKAYNRSIAQANMYGNNLLETTWNS